MKKWILALAIGMTHQLLMAQQTPVIDQKQETQREQIKEGRVNGDIGPVEGHKLRKQQRKIQRMESRAKSDGVVTGRERRGIRRQQREADRSIRRAANN